jgi:hypothetical protein
LRIEKPWLEENIPGWCFISPHNANMALRMKHPRHFPDVHHLHPLSHVDPWQPARRRHLCPAVQLVSIISYQFRIISRIAPTSTSTTLWGVSKGTQTTGRHGKRSCTYLRSCRNGWYRQGISCLWPWLLPLGSLWWLGSPIALYYVTPETLLWSNLEMASSISRTFVSVLLLMRVLTWILCVARTLPSAICSCHGEPSLHVQVWTLLLVRRKYSSCRVIETSNKQKSVSSFFPA